MLDYGQRAIEELAKHRGNWCAASKLPLESKEDLSIAYTPGVAAPCLAIKENPEEVYRLTMKANTIAVISDGSAILGLGNIGPEAGLPVMEGKSALYKKYADIDAVPIVLASQNIDEVVRAIEMIALTFGGIHLEDIAAPSCFDIEKRLIASLNIPVMHDDQHATAIIVLAGLWNALKVVGKDMAAINIVILGAGAAGIATARLLLTAGAQHITVLDTRGILALGRAGMNGCKDEIAQTVNPAGRQGDLAAAMVGADVFIGVSRANLVTQDMVRSMAERPILFCLANPVPEIMPDLAKEAGAAVVATGRSDFPNQVNNVLVYPGLFRGLLNTRARKLTDQMRLAAARAVTECVPSPTAEKILPSIFEENPAPLVAAAVAKGV